MSDRRPLAVVDYLTVFGARMRKGERIFLRLEATRIAARFPSPIFVNVGVLCGCSMWCLRAGASDAVLYGIDIDYSRPVKEREALNATFIKGDSGIVHSDFPHPIHILFIDGDHHYESVRADTMGWTPKVVSGGTVIFHDYNPARNDLYRMPSLAGVKKAVDEWVTTWSGDDPWHVVTPPAPGSLFAARRGRGGNMNRREGV